ncbi:hypothetical protein GOV07_01845 [Candidatus Woesearchaeota archaeon]|nr:hypothetical protein [Candidatus Woesearchaeota archaeon]
MIDVLSYLGQFFGKGQPSDGHLRSASVKKIYNPGRSYCLQPDSVEVIKDEQPVVNDEPMPELEPELLKPEMQVDYVEQGAIEGIKGSPYTTLESRIPNEWTRMTGLPSARVNTILDEHVNVSYERWREIREKYDVNMGEGEWSNEKRLMGESIEDIFDELTSEDLLGLVDDEYETNGEMRLSLRERLNSGTLEERHWIAAQLYDRCRNDEQYQSIDTILEKTDVKKYALMKEVDARGIEKRAITTERKREKRRGEVASYMIDGEGSVKDLAERLGCSTSTIYHDMSVVRFEESEKREEFIENHAEIMERFEKHTEHSKTVNDYHTPSR